MTVDPSSHANVQVRGLSPAPQSAYRSTATPQAARPSKAVKGNTARSGGSQSTVSQTSKPDAADSFKPHDRDSHPVSKRSRLSDHASASAAAQPQGSAGHSHGLHSAALKTGAVKAVTKPPAEPIQNANRAVAAAAPAPPPGSPTASSKTEEVAPPPPPAVPPPPSDLSPSSSRTLPVAGSNLVATAAQASAQSQPRPITLPTPKLAKPVIQQQQLSQRVQPQQQQQQLKLVLPRQAVPETSSGGAGAAISTVAANPGIAPKRQAHVTHMEQQHPPQVQLPVYVAPRYPTQQQQQQQQPTTVQQQGQQQASMAQRQAQQQQGLAQQAQGVMQHDLQSFRQGQALAMYQVQCPSMPQQQGQANQQGQFAEQGHPQPGQLHPGHSQQGHMQQGHVLQGRPQQRASQTPPWLQEQGSGPHIQAFAQDPNAFAQHLNPGTGMPGMHAQQLHPAQPLRPPGPSFAQPYLGFVQPFQSGMPGGGDMRHQAPSMQPGWLRPNFL